jgi:hypothetical protein
MNTVITHFYNEEYLLPWWINHHKKLFDHGIMINHHSTDRSVEICKELCPSHWKIVDSINNDFNANACDNEVKEYEKTVDGFKLTLTVTEFLLSPMSLNEINEKIFVDDVQYLKTFGVCMVDIFPHICPSYEKSLIEQKHHGIIENNIFQELVGRYYHNQSFGDYGPGRHNLNNYYTTITSNEIFVLKYKFSPWNESMIQRMEQIGSKVPQSDLSKGWGRFHTLSRQDFINDYYNNFIDNAYNLTKNITFKAAFDYCNSL